LGPVDVFNPLELRGKDIVMHRHGEKLAEKVKKRLRIVEDDKGFAAACSISI
jgi:hypothetical protein